MKKILFVASEAVPYVKTGGLADVTGSLPKYFNSDEYDVRVILPKYACMSEQDKKKLHHELHFYVDLGWRKQYAGILSAKADGITYYFVDNEYYFAGDQPYNNIYEDVEKFAFFCKAVLEALPRLSYMPDILHCHDWQTALVPVYLEQFYKADPFYQRMKTVLTIHNLQFQGRFHLQTVRDITGLPQSMFTPDKLEAYGEANYLKGGIIYADAVTTVSPTYAKDILTTEGGEGLDGVLRSYSYKLRGIINGIDNQVYNPQTDSCIPCNYSRDNLLAGKEVNKKALLMDMGLPYDPQKLVVGIVSRITEQKGYALIDYMMEEILSSGKIQLVVLGTGEERYQNMLKHFEWRYPELLKANITYSEKLAHSIYAGVDALLMPSQFEPCGLSQLMSMRYGTVPIVRETGGLKDTVIPYNENENTGTGFSFSRYNAHDMRDAIYYAHRVYSGDKDRWHGIMCRGMEQDFSWEKSARAYEDLYNRL